MTEQQVLRPHELGTCQAMERNQLYQAHKFGSTEGGTCWDMEKCDRVPELGLGPWTKTQGVRNRVGGMHGG